MVTSCLHYQCEHVVPKWLKDAFSFATRRIWQSMFRNNQSQFYEYFLNFLRSHTLTATVNKYVGHTSIFKVGPALINDPKTDGSVLICCKMQSNFWFLKHKDPIIQESRNIWHVFVALYKRVFLEFCGFVLCASVSLRATTVQWSPQQIWLSRVSLLCKSIPKLPKASHD